MPQMDIDIIKRTLHIQMENCSQHIAGAAAESRVPRVQWITILSCYRVKYINWSKLNYLLNISKFSFSYSPSEKMCVSCNYIFDYCCTHFWTHYSNKSHFLPDDLSSFTSEYFDPLDHWMFKYICSNQTNF